ncbi:hypothetical protein HPB47_016533 [Ixodes persulcatus]|uniref:Uncharacterized protein n=1 Tax=Ixodes persulcatus TaxID=34615 RepID=A0AC60QRM1_IXOPE|nr:hypothetical protein HPB47_016533 [Ixodes persulcatus]
MVRELRECLKTLKASPQNSSTCRETLSPPKSRTPVHRTGTSRIRCQSLQFLLGAVQCTLEQCPADRPSLDKDPKDPCRGAPPLQMPQLSTTT